jgi:hypothetical protein
MPVAMGPAMSVRAVTCASLVLTIDDVPFELVKDLLDLRRRVQPAIGLTGILDIVLQILDIPLFLGIDRERH